MSLAQWVRLAPGRFWEDLVASRRVSEDDALLEPDPVGEFLSTEEEAGQSVGEDSGAPAVADPEPQVVGAESKNAEIMEPLAVNREQSLGGQEPGAEELAETSFDGQEERVGQLEDEAEETAAVAGAGPQALEADGQNTEMIEQSPANGEQTLDGQEAEAAGLVELALDGNGEGVGQLEDEAEVVVATGNAAPEGLEAGSQGGEASDVPQAEEVGAMAEAAPEAFEAGSQGGEASDVPQAEEHREGNDTDDLLDIFKAEKLEDSPITVLSQGLSDVSIDFLLAETKRIAGRFRKAH